MKGDQNYGKTDLETLKKYQDNTVCCPHCPPCYPHRRRWYDYPDHYPWDWYPPRYPNPYWQGPYWGTNLINHQVLC